MSEKVYADALEAARYELIAVVVERADAEQLFLDRLRREMVLLNGINALERHTGQRESDFRVRRERIRRVVRLLKVAPKLAAVDPVGELAKPDPTPRDPKSSFKSSLSQAQGAER